MLFALPSQAQQQATGRIIGTISERISSRPVQLVLISIAREVPDSAVPLEVHPDAKGRFSIDGVAAGRYVVRVTTPLLDSLGLALPEREVNVAAGETTHLDYGLPYGPALRDAVCPGLTLDRGKAAVSGHATDAGTDLPLADADVAVAWTELVVDRSTLKTSALEHAAAVNKRNVVRDVQLERATTLDTIVVTDYRTRFREFEFNRGMYIMAGDFLTADMIARRKPQPETGDLVDRMPGFHVVGHGAVAKAFTQRALQRNSTCKANVVVDGVEEMGVNDVPPNMVQGIEVYVSPPKPSIYHREGCGLVVIWTKNWRRPTRPVPASADTTAWSIQ